MKKIFFLSSLAILLLAAMVVPALAQWSVGVQVGDWFLYETELIQWTTTAVPFPPWWNPELQTINTTDWIKYTVTTISGEDITFSVVTHWSNGTETTVDAIESMTSSPAMMVIGANLTQGTQIRPESEYFGPMTLNASRTRTFNNSISREVNVLNYTGYLINTEYLWDKQTGIQVLYYTGGIAVYDFQTESEVTYWARIELKDSSISELDIIPDMTGPILLSALMALTLPIILLSRRKKFV